MLWLLRGLCTSVTARARRLTAHSGFRAVTRSFHVISQFSFASSRQCAAPTRLTRRDQHLHATNLHDSVLADSIRCHDEASDHQNEHANRMIWLVIPLPSHLPLHSGCQCLLHTLPRVFEAPPHLILAILGSWFAFLCPTQPNVDGLHMFSFSVSAIRFDGCRLTVICQWLL